LESIGLGNLEEKKSDEIHIAVNKTTRAGGGPASEEKDAISAAEDFKRASDALTVVREEALLAKKSFQEVQDVGNRNIVEKARADMVIAEQNAANAKLAVDKSRAMKDAAAAAYVSMKVNMGSDTAKEIRGQSLTNDMRQKGIYNSSVQTDDSVSGGQPCCSKCPNCSPSCTCNRNNATTQESMRGTKGEVSRLLSSEKEENLPVNLGNSLTKPEKREERKATARVSRLKQDIAAERTLQENIDQGKEVGSFPGWAPENLDNLKHQQAVNATSGMFERAETSQKIALKRASLRRAVLDHAEKLLTSARKTSFEVGEETSHAFNKIMQARNASKRAVQGMQEILKAKEDAVVEMEKDVKKMALVAQQRAKAVADAVSREKYFARRRSEDKSRIETDLQLLSGSGPSGPSSLSGSSGASGASGSSQQSSASSGTTGATGLYLMEASKVAAEASISATKRLTFSRLLTLSKRKKVEEAQASLDDSLGAERIATSALKHWKASPLYVSKVKAEEAEEEASELVRHAQFDVASSVRDIQEKKERLNQVNKSHIDALSWAKLNANADRESKENKERAETVKKIQKERALPH